MIPEMLVATDWDFSLLRGTRPVAAGQWDEVTRVTASQRDGVARLRVTLEDGRAFTASDDAPGWDDFVGAAERMLDGFPVAHEWMPTLKDGAAPQVLFER